MPAVYEYRHTVQPHEIDGNGHTNNVAYVSWMQEAAVAHSTAQGWSTERYTETGTAWIARSHSIEYLAESLEGDDILVRTWVADMRKIMSLRRYHVHRATDGLLLATAETNWVFVGLERRNPKRIPPEVADAFDIVDEPPSLDATSAE